MIGIVTFHRAKNYGAVLQAYALQETLKSLGKESILVDYRCRNIENRYKLFPINKNNLIKSFTKSVAAFPIRFKKKYGYDNFLNKYLNISKSYCTLKDLEIDAEKYRVFITGSDQVFRVSEERFDEAYFLEFAKSEQKYSYAASFGVKEIDDKFKARVKQLLSDFQDISLRETDGKKIVEDLTGYEARVDLDPTLLLNKEKWGSICKSKYITKPYVLVYNVNPYNNLMSFALSLANQKGLDVIYIKDGFVKINGNVKFKRGISPSEFISLFKYADNVVTNSFHGTAFSVIFEKEFFVEMETKSGRNFRAESLLDELEINSREIISPKYNNDEFSKIDWKSVNNILSSKRNYSIGYLKEL